MASALPLLVSALLMLVFINTVEGVPYYQECNCFTEEQGCPMAWAESDLQTCDTNEKRCCPPLRIFFFPFPQMFPKGDEKYPTTDEPNSLEYKWG